ncbi:class I SAM-dependent methyltransferase, partial [candidate division WOR-3 bacterium]|nr:class I SAM-dependent methyltransferase [candidate division WOR-3 bacterium]
EENRHCIQLYHHVAGGVDLTGKDVLEVGCGRGGGASYVARYRGPGSVTGIDIAARAIEFCREHHTAPNLGFQQGDAEALPFADGSFDAVINVESSHFYASMARFLAEVMRTLRPGGHFLFADFRNRHGTRNMRPQLERAGFEVLREERITTNILHALRLDSERKYGLIQARVPWFLRHVFREFASTDGTATYEAFRGRRWEYFSFVLRKNGAAS